MITLLNQETNYNNTTYTKIENICSRNYLSIYLFLLLIIPDIHIYKSYITKSTGGNPFGWLWFIPSVILLFALVWILLSSREALAAQHLIGTFTITYMVIVLPKTIFMICSLLDLPLKYLFKWQIQPFSWLGIILGTGIMLMVLYGAIWGKTRFNVKQVTFASPDLPAAFDGHRIALCPTYTRVVGTETGLPCKKPWT